MASLWPRYLVPADIPEEQYDVNAQWMVPAEDVNRDYNETILDGEGYDLTARLASLEDSPLDARATGYRMWLGRRQCDMGCGETIDSIRSFLGSAVYNLCKDGLCDAGDGVKYVRKIDWQGSGTRTSRWLEVTTMGTYTGPHTLGNMHNLVKASVRPETVKWAWRKWVGTHTGIVTSACKMAKFPNYIRIDKPSPNKVDVQFWIRVNHVDGACLATSATAAVAAGINGAVGAFFGLVNLMCQQG